MKLTTKEIAFLTKAYAASTQLSLFANINSPLDGTEEKSLVEKGVYKDGELKEPAKEMLDIVAMAEKCSRLMLKDSSCVVEKYTYKVADKIVLVENEGGEMLFSLHQSLSKTISELSEFTGISRIKRSGIELLLPVDEMLVLLAMADIYRKNALLSYVGKDKEKDSIPLAEIVKQLDEPAPNSLVQMLKKNYHYSVPPIETTKEALEKLAGKNCIVFDQGYRLIGEYAIFANGFLIPETIVMLEALNLNKNNEVVSAGALCVCAGIKDIASLIFSKDEIELASISGMQLLQIAENFLQCPDISES